MESSKVTLPLDVEAVAYMSEVLKLLADRNRLLMLALLQHGEMCVCELVQVIPLSQPAVSGNLRKLKSYGLVKETKKKNWVYYSLTIDDKPYVRAILQHVPNVTPLIEDLEQRGLRVCLEGVSS